MPDSPAAARARFFNSANAFNVTLPPVPAATFVDELRAARAARMTGLHACDQSAALATPFAATTPLMLARYAVIMPNETLRVSVPATVAIWYVIDGAGSATIGAERFAFGAGDIVVAPGGIPTALHADDAGALLWLVTNEPQLAFDDVAPVERAAGPVEIVHYPSAEIARQLDAIVNAPRGPQTAGNALIFSSERQLASRNVSPTLTLSLNSLAAGERQRAHRHNSAAVTLVVAGAYCYSLIDGVRCDWSPFATLVTPATAAHTHHNEGDERALFLIVQDGGFHYHARTMGFTFLESEA